MGPQECEKVVGWWLSHSIGHLYDQNGLSQIGVNIISI